MIIYSLFVIFIGLINLIVYPISALPDVSLSSGIGAGLTAAAVMLGTFYQIVPWTLGALGGIISALLAFELAIWSYKIIKWIYTKIPGIS